MERMKNKCYLRRDVEREEKGRDVRIVRDVGREENGREGC